MTTDERKRTEGCRPPPFPDDFGRRLERLKELVGVSWREFAERLGVTQRGMLKWRRGGPPSGAYLWAIIELARDVPGGYKIVMSADDNTAWKDMKEVKSMATEELDRIREFCVPPRPEDIPVYLERLEDLSGTSLEEFVSVLGLPEDRPGKWRSGEMPNADDMWALMQWACRVPGGLSVLLTGCPYSLTVRE